MLVDKNGTPQANGQNPETKAADVRTLPTGTLIFNLIKYTAEEVGIENIIHQLEAAKKQQKILMDPPQLTMMRDHHAQMAQYRYVLAKELNERFESIDQSRLASIGVEVHDLAAPSAPAEPEKTSES